MRCADGGSMATIWEKHPGQWHMQIWRKGWPPITETFRTEKEALAYARDAQFKMDKKVFVDRSAGERTARCQAIERYIKDVTQKRRSETSAASEEARLRRFLREERDLCEHALANLTHEHFEAWRDRRLTDTASRGSPYKPEPPAPKGRTQKDGSPRKNAAKPKALPKPPKTISAGTVKREMTLLKKVLDFAVKTYKLVEIPLGTRIGLPAPPSRMNGTYGLPRNNGRNCSSKADNPAIRGLRPMSKSRCKSERGPRISIICVGMTSISPTPR